MKVVVLNTTNARFFSKNVYYSGNLTGDDQIKPVKGGDPSSQETNAEFKAAQLTKLQQGKWEASIKGILMQIVSARTGKAVANAIASRGSYNMLIVPWAKPGTLNAWAVPELEAHGFVDKAFRALGLRKGNNVLVNFTASKWSHSSGPATKPDEILIHEMTHGVQEMSGTLDSNTFNPDIRGRKYSFNAVCEFVAVLVANMYVSEKSHGHAQLRMDHSGQYLPGNLGIKFAVLPHKESSAQFAKDFRPQLRELCSTDGSFFNQLASIDCSFNPPRDYKKQEGFIDKVRDWL